MRVREHLLLGGGAALALSPWLGIHSAAFGLATILMDGDHYLDYVWRNGFRDFSPKRALTFHLLLFPRLKGAGSLGLNTLHTLEFQGLVVALWLLTGYPWLVAALGGMLFHWLLDCFYLYRLGGLWRRSFSVIEYLIRWEGMKARGQDPFFPYRDTLEVLFGRRLPATADRGREDPP